MKLAGPTHVSKVQPQFITTVVDDRVTMQRQVPQCKWRGDETVDISLNSVQRQNGGYQLYNREQMPQEQFQRLKQKQNPSPQSSEENRDSTVTACKTAHTTLEKTLEGRDTLGQAVVRIVNGTARVWSILHEIREIISPVSIKQAMEMQAEAEHRKHEEILQSEGDQQSEINLARRRSTRLGQC